MCRQLPNWRAVLCGVSYLIVCYFYLFLAFSQSQPTCCLQRNTLSKRWQRQRGGGLSVQCQRKMRLQQSQWARHHIMKHVAAWTSPLRKSYKRGSHRDGLWVPHQQKLKSRPTSQKKTPLRKATHFSTGKNMLISFPLWLLLQPSISVPPAALWTVRDFLVPLQTSLMRTETGSNLTR